MGVLCTFEGIDGCGKSHHLAHIAQALIDSGQKVIVTREPGGTPLGEKLREMLLHEAMDPLTETLLMFAARKEHLEQVIKPALESGHFVLCDRFTDSSVAYQGGGKRVSYVTLLSLEAAVQSHAGGIIQPDLTLWFDVDPAIAEQRRAAVRVADKFEQENVDFFSRVRATYASRQQTSGGRIVRIDASKPIEAVAMDVKEELSKRGYIKSAIAMA